LFVGDLYYSESERKVSHYSPLHHRRRDFLRRENERNWIWRMRTKVVVLQQSVDVTHREPSSPWVRLKMGGY
jgi:hypothetical protein